MIELKDLEEKITVVTNKLLSKNAFKLLKAGIYGTYDKRYDRTVFWYTDCKDEDGCDIIHDICLDYCYGCYGDADYLENQEIDDEIAYNYIIPQLLKNDIILYSENLGEYIVPLDFQQINRLRETLDIKEVYMYQPAFRISRDNIVLELRLDDDRNFCEALDKCKRLLNHHEILDNAETDIIHIVIDMDDTADYFIVNHILFDNMIKVNVEEVTE